MSVTLDTDVLLFASNVGAPEHEQGAALVAHLAAGPSLVVLLWPTVLGYLRLATHPSIFSSPLSHAEAAANIESLLDRPHVRAAGEA